MFRIVQMISPEVLNSINDYLNEVIEPQLTKDVSSYADSRMRAWLQYEAPLSISQPWKPAIKDDRIWSYVTKIGAKNGFTPDIGLISKAGVIREHRDAFYCNFLSMGINLGECTWTYRNCYPEYKWTANQNDDAPQEIYHLTGGEVFLFNAKNPHSVSRASEERWAINLWTVSKKGMSGFNEIKEAGQ